MPFPGPSGAGVIAPVKGSTAVPRVTVLTMTGTIWTGTLDGLAPAMSALPPTITPTYAPPSRLEMMTSKNQCGTWTGSTAIRWPSALARMVRATSPRIVSRVMPCGAGW